MKYSLIQLSCYNDETKGKYISVMEIAMETCIQTIASEMEFVIKCMKSKHHR